MQIYFFPGAHLSEQKTFWQFSLAKLVSKTMDWGRNSSTTVNKVSTAKFAYRHYRAATQKSAEFNPFASFFARGRNKSASSSFIVHHSDCKFISQNSRNCCCRSIARNCNHIKTNGTNCCHCFQFFKAD